MNKWEYIRLISKRGSVFGNADGVLDLLHWCEKPNTIQVTDEEAQLFWENPLAPPPAHETQASSVT